MASQALICAHKNIFNAAILGSDALYFQSANDVTSLLNTLHREQHQDKIDNNIKKIKEQYHYQTIISKYETLFKKHLKQEV